MEDGRDGNNIAPFDSDERFVCSSCPIRVYDEHGGVAFAKPHD